MSQRWQWVVRLGCFASLCLVLQSPAWAQDDLAARKRASAELTGEAAIAFNAGDLERARDLLLKAREAFANPIIDYNLGRAYEGLGLPNLAVEAYTRYLTAVPDAANAGLVRQRIDMLSSTSTSASANIDSAHGGQTGDRDDLHEYAPSEPTSGQSSSSLSPWAFVIGGVGIVTCGVGVGLHLEAQAQADAALVAPEDQVGALRAVESARDQNTLANVFIVTGAAVAAAGIVWLIVELAGGEQNDVQASETGISVRF